MHTSAPGFPTLDYVKPAALAEAGRLLVEQDGAARPFFRKE